MVENSKQKIYWVGPRESDISDCKELFAGSITTFGSNKEGNIALCDENSCIRVDCNNGDAKQNGRSNTFMREKIINIIKKDAETRFYFYNGNAYNFIGDLEKYRSSFICLNDSELMQNLNDKNFFHEVIKSKLDKSVELLEVRSGNSSDCDYFNICQKFEMDADEERAKDTRFIFQAPISSGGSGTYILNIRGELGNGAEIKKNLKENDKYLFSVYRENNVSVNIHAIIFDENILFTPGSVQLMKEDENRLMYRGADFLAFRDIDEKIKTTFKNDALEICKVIQKMGYRGVCGIDAIVFKGQVKVIEINNRFQTSSYLINKSLKNSKGRTLQEINMDAFAFPRPREEDVYTLSNISVEYSNFAFIYNDIPIHANHIIESGKNEKEISSFEYDGYDKNARDFDSLTKYVNDFGSLSQLFKVTFKTNISWINEEGTLYIHENVSEPLKPVKEKIYAKDPLYFKTALMTQGVVFTPRAKKFLEESGGIRPGNNNAIDIRIENVNIGGRDRALVVNAPLGTKFVALSPFSIDLRDDGKFILYYYHKEMYEVNLYLFDKFSLKQTKSNNISYGEIAYLSTDRLRIHLTNRCVFKMESNKSCKFCDIEMSCGDIPIEDIQEVIKDYVDNCPDLRHFLIGGQSAKDDISKDKLIKIIGYIKKTLKSHKMVYSMTLPYGKTQINKMLDEGLNELAFNIEIFTPELAKKYMPGKGEIDREKYFERLAYATAFGELSKKGRVKSMVIYGLEPREAFIQGIEKLAQMGVQPLISVFRPLPKTSLENLIAPSIREIVEIYEKAEEICQKCGLHLGPECEYCQNNTLSLPH